MPRRWVLTDETRLPDPAAALEDITRQHRGQTGIIFRHYGDDSRAEHAHRLADMCRRHAIPLLIAGDARLALEAGANGLHLPEWLAARPRLWRPITHHARLTVTMAVHSRPALARASQLGVDGVLISPVLATQSHPGARPLGPLRFAALAREAPEPMAVYALGGMSENTMARLKETSATGWAGISAWG